MKHLQQMKQMSLIVMLMNWKTERMCARSAGPIMMMMSIRTLESAVIMRSVAAGFIIGVQVLNECQHHANNSYATTAESFLLTH